MMIRVEETDERCLVTVNGEMTIYTAAQIKDAITPVMFEARDMELHLGDVDEIDSAGMQILMAVQRARGTKGLALTINAAGSAVTDVCELYRFDLNSGECDNPAETRGEQNGV